MAWALLGVNALCDRFAPNNEHARSFIFKNFLDLPVVKTPNSELDIWV